MSVSMIRRQLLIGAAALTASTMTWAAGPLNLDNSGVAIHGHGPVAHFVDGRPVTDRAELRHIVNAATCWFANDGNLQAFKAVDGKLYVKLSPAVQTRWAPTSLVSSAAPT